MLVENNKKICKSDVHTMNKVIKKLESKLVNYNISELYQRPEDGYLIHDRFFVNSKFFFTFKAVVVKQQIRVLCYVSNEKVIIINYIFKTNSKIKYHEDFRKFANAYYSNVICAE